MQGPDVVATDVARVRPLYARDLRAAPERRAARDLSRRNARATSARRPGETRGRHLPVPIDRLL